MKKLDIVIDRDKRNNRHLLALQTYLRSGCDVFEPDVCNACDEAKKHMVGLLEMAKNN